MDKGCAVATGAALRQPFTGSHLSKMILACHDLLAIASKRTFLNIAGRPASQKRGPAAMGLMRHTGRITALVKDDPRLPARNDVVLSRLGSENYVF